MIKLLTAEQMRRCDRAAIEDYGIPDVVLMENAGTQVVEAMHEFLDGIPGRVTVCCGKGNNGGDGLVVARHLHNQGVDVRVVLFAGADELEGSPATNLGIVEALGLELVEIPDADAWERRRPALGAPDCVVDALFGTGIEGALRGHYGDVVRAVADAGVPVVAVDLPSGLETDSGEVPGPAVRADLTVTLAAPKLCHVLPPAESLCGALVVADIGIPERVLRGVDDAVSLLSPIYAALLVPPRSPDSHKGTYGRVLIVAGSPGTTGAASLTALGALRGGAGLVTVATPHSVYPVVASQLTEALVHPVSAGEDEGLASAAVDEIRELASGVDVLALGPGLGTAPETVDAIRALLRDAAVPAVVDADGLNALAGALDVLEDAPAPRILTPHPGEMARLMETDTGSIQGDRLGHARTLASDTGATVVLKGHRSVIAAPQGDVALNPTGNPGMASGGAGDVLTGLVAALLGQSLDPVSAAHLGVFAHGLAGDIASEAVGEIALVAGDLVDHLPDVFARLERILDDELDPVEGTGAPTP